MLVPAQTIERPQQNDRHGKPKTGGRKKGVENKRTLDLKAVAQKHARSAIATLKRILMDTNETGSTRVSAARELLDRGYGKPLAQVAHTGANDGPIKFEEMPNLELARRMAFVFSRASKDKANDLEARPTEH